MTDHKEIKEQPKCKTCGDSGTIPTFDQASQLADADPCPDCTAQEQPPASDFTKECRGILRRCDMPRRTIADAQGSSIWSNVIWKKLDTETQRRIKAEAENKSLSKSLDVAAGFDEDREEKIEQLEAKLKAKDELLFAYESVKAPVNPLLAINKDLREACDKVRDWLDTSSLQQVLVHYTEDKRKHALIMGIASHLEHLEATIAKAKQS